MKVGCICYCTEQGLGHLAKDFYDNGVVTHPMLVRHRHHENHPEWYPEDTPWLTELRSVTRELDNWLRELDALIAFETPFNWQVFDFCKQHRVKSVLVPMYEWTPRIPPALPDVVACPSSLDYEYFGVGSSDDRWYSTAKAWRTTFTKVVEVLIPVDRRIKWQRRNCAINFLHNAGHVGHRGHKGTLELIKAIPYVRSPELRLTVRFQDEREISKTIERELIQFRVAGDPRVVFEYGSRSYNGLFDDYDVYIAPEKFNGLSLPLQEACAAGMVVMASNRFPHNDWLPGGPLIPVSRYERACIGSNYLEFDEAVIEPEAIAATIDGWVGQDITDLSNVGREWGQKHSWSVLKSKWLEVLSK